MQKIQIKRFKIKQTILTSNRSIYKGNPTENDLNRVNSECTDLELGYQVWINPTMLFLSVLLYDRMNLMMFSIKDNTSKTLHKNVGNSSLKIPNSNLISFVSYENGISSIKPLDQISEAIDTIKSFPNPIEDICWLTDTILLIPDGNMINQLNIVDDTISILHYFKEEEISQISVCTAGKHLAFASEKDSLQVFFKLT